nr:helicase-related protein [Dehalococcoidales bacterium]
RGRRVLVFITHTESRDISPRLRLILEREGFRVAVLKASTVSADRREEWVAARVREGTDVLICHPRLVQTGLDLVGWPSIVWFEPEYSVYVLRQASRRSWRVGQRHPVEVTYLVYEGTLQAEALALVAAKMRSSLMIEGELPEDGLAALEGDGQDVFLALARRLTERGSGEEQSLESLFAQSRAIEAEAEDYLVDGEWEIPATPMAPMLAPTLSASQGNAAELWQRVFNGETRAEVGPAAALAPGTNGRVVTFEELASLVRRPKPRRKPVPEGQLALFDG